MLGLQDFWRYSSFRTGSGNGYINVASGNMVYTSVDSVYPGMLMAMVMRRTYNSQATTKTTLGYGWDFSYNTCLMKEYDDNGNDIGMILKDGDGSLHRFSAVQGEEGNYSAPSGLFMELKYDSSTGGYKVTRKDNISYIFDANFKLVKMTEFDRNYIEFEYDESGKLFKVISKDYGGTAYGEASFFYYQNSDSNAPFYTTDAAKLGLLAQMIDPANRVFNYTYQLSTGYLQVAELDIPNTTSDYEEEFVYETGTHKITGIYDGKDKLTQITYDDMEPDKVDGVIFPITSESYSLNYGTNTTTLTDGWGHSTVYNFDSTKRYVTTSITNAMGYTTSYTYNPDLQVTGFSYYNFVEGASVATLHSYSITYDGEGNIESVTNPKGHVTLFENYNLFNQVGKVTVKESSTAATGVETSYNYDDDGEGDTGNLLVTTDAEGRTTTYTYNANGTINTITSSLGSMTKYLYNSNGWLTEVRQGKSSSPDGLTTVSQVISYDNMGNPTVTEDGMGNQTKTVYDALGRAHKTILPATTYLNGDSVINNIFTEVVYDLNHNIIFSRGISEDGGSQGLQSTYEYDGLDRLTGVNIDTMNRIYHSSIDYGTYTDGTKTYRKVTYEDAEGNISVEYYDALGRIKKTSIKDGSTEIITATYEYDRVGNMISVTDNNGVKTEAKYDELNRQTCTIIDPNGKNIRSYVQYDYMGNVVKTIGAKGTDDKKAVTEYVYDGLGRVTEVKEHYINDSGSDDEHTTHYTYDITTGVSNNAIFKNTVEDANGNVKETHFDALGRAVYEVNIGDGAGSNEMEVSKTYNNNGQLETVTYADGQTDKYEYNSWGQIDLIKYGVDANGSTNNKTIYKYDELGRLGEMDDDRVDVDNINTVHTTISTWAYDTIGRITQLKQDNNTINYTYNGVNQVETITYKENISNTLPTATIGYQYDNYGRLKYITKEENSTVCTAREYVYEANKTRLDYTIDYIEFDDASGTNQKITDYGYNTIGQVQSITYKDSISAATALEKYVYTYCNNGNIEQEEIYLYDRANDGDKVVKDYEYDKLGRLLNSTVSEYINSSTATNVSTTTWTYDAVGNRKTQDDGTHYLDYSYNEFNQLTGINIIDGQTTLDYMDFTYNARGAQIQQTETLSDGTTQETTNYDYDAAGRLAKITAGSDVSKYLFNGQGQRVQQTTDVGTANEKTTKYYYTGSALLFTTDNNDVKLTENILTPSGSIVASQRFTGTYANNFYFYNYDIRGSVTAIIDNGFNLMQGYEYDEFGNKTTTGNQVFINEVTFTGAVSDTSGLYYMNARFYNPNTGRFLSQDTYSGNAYEPWTQHLYSYVGNNPINMIDPTGHSGEKVNSNSKQMIFDVVSGVIMVSTFYLTGSCTITRDQGSRDTILVDPIPDIEWPRLEEFPMPNADDLPRTLTFPLPDLTTKGKNNTQHDVEVPVFPHIIVDPIPVDLPSIRIVAGIQHGVGGNGWRGDKDWRDNVKTLYNGGNIKTLNGGVPTVEEAMDLLNEAGCKVLRVEYAHGFPNPHNYPHINYKTPFGTKGAVKVTEVLVEMFFD